MRFDSHVHVFDARTALREVRRYVPQADASADALLGVMAKAHIDGAVLVQTSFAANPDNLFAAAEEHPGHFRVVASAINEDELETNLAVWAQRGAVGVRLNLLGKPAPELASRRWQALGDELAELGLHLEIHAAGDEWKPLLPALRDWPSDVVIDHLGRTTDAEAMLALANDNERVWFKVSAPYRWPDHQAGLELLGQLVTTCPRRLLWASDWPHTQHESEVSYSKMVAFAQDHYPSSLLDTFDDNLQALLGSRRFEI